MANTLVPFLEKTVSPDQNELTSAQQFLEQAAATNFPEYVRTLSEVLATVGHSSVARMASGLQLKNLLTSKDSAMKGQYQQRWLMLADDIRAYVKKNVLGALGTETTRPSSAAQCVAYIAVTELSQNQWPEVISYLVNNVTQGSAVPNGELMKEASLEAIGYICADIEPEILMTQSNHILTAIVHGMKRDEPSNKVRLAATNALLNSLEFTKSNFDNEQERHYIMQVVCEATQCEDTNVKVAALQCLVKIMSLYYQHMEFYMKHALFAITMDAMRSDVDEVALQGIEFWSNVCDEEVDLAIELSEAQELGRPPQRTSRFYAKGGLQFLVPLLLEALTKQELVDDDDDWNPCKAAGVCLMLFTNCCEDAIIPHVIPFVQTNIKHENWRFRDAAVMAFGCIMEGPDPTSMKPLAEDALPTLISLMSDENVVVRDTTAWALGRICEVVSDAALTASHLPPLLTALVAALQAEPRVAANACWALSSLAEAAYETSLENRVDDSKDPDTYLLSSFFRPIVEKLLATTDRADGGQANLRPAAYEALMEMIKNSPRDCYETVQHTTLVILERLRTVLVMENHANGGDRTQYNELQSSLCATLQIVLRKVSPQDAPKISDAVMNALLQMLSGPGGRSGGVQEDALMAISTLTEVMGEGFIKYMDSFQPFLITGLQNVSESAVCSAAVGVSGDICRSLGNKALPYCDDIMTLLLQNLGNANVQRSVKPQILSVLGDVALAIGPEFKKYLEVVLQTLMQASQAQVDRTDYEMVDYLCELREGVLEAYTGIIQGLRGDAACSVNPGGAVTPDLTLIESHLPYMAQFLCEVARDTDKSDGNIAAAAGLVGDLLVGYGAKIMPLMDNDVINEVLTLGRRSKTNKTKMLATWATKELRKLKNHTSAAAS
ncbi:importin subunit beta-1 isoform X2 [Folsomia candida]|nr:importin subunit beta-1 isoform X2 [Folsomia candida]